MTDGRGQRVDLDDPLPSFAEPCAGGAATLTVRTAFAPPRDWPLGDVSLYDAAPPALQGLWRALAENALVVVDAVPSADEAGVLLLDCVGRDAVWGAGPLAAGPERLCLESLQAAGAWETVADLARVRIAAGEIGFSVVALKQALQVLDAWEELAETLPGLYQRTGDPWLIELLSRACLRLGRHAEAVFAAHKFGELVPDQRVHAQDMAAQALIAEGVTWPMSLLPDATLGGVENFSAPAVERCLASNLPSDRLRGLDLDRRPAEALAILRDHHSIAPELRSNAEAWERYVQAGVVLADASDAALAHGVLTYSTSNIGDDFQSLAAAQYLDEAIPLDFFDRDALSTPVRGTSRRTIMNGWYAHRGELGATWPPSAAIDPVPVSMHIHSAAATTILSPDGVDWLRRHAPVGCRDEATLRLLQRHGVEANLTGCLTLTLRQPTPESVSRQTVWAVDLDPASVHVMDAAVAAIGLGAVQRRTHDFVVGRRDPLFRLLLAARMLREYARAQVVVTSRLHCALPCIAYGTPVVMVVPNDRDPRMVGLVPDGVMVSQAAFAADPQGLIRRAISQPHPVPARAELLRASVAARTGLPERSWYARLMEMSERVWA